MVIRCPYCSFAIELKGIRAGHFTPKCPKCAQKFALVIHSDPNMQPTVTATNDALDAEVAAALGIRESKLPIAATQVQAKTPSAGTNVTQMPASAGATSVPTQQTVRPQSSKPTGEQSAAQRQPKPNVGATSVPIEPAKSNGIGATSVPHAQPHEPPPATPSGEPDADIPPGTTLGGYEVLQKLGAGGMGAVYLARQVSLDRNVALKTLHKQLAKDAQLVSRFTREAYAAAQLTHHNIVQIHDIGQDKETNFFSMEFVNGTTLASTLREAGKLDTETAVSYVLQAARGLKFAHDHGLIHRDVKPENLLLNDQGIVKVADLGLVKRVGSNETENMQLATAQESGVAVTQVNKSMGTPLYMPPEQALDAARVDHRADIYSLGCTLYHLVTGRPPFMGRTAMEVMTKHQHEPVTPPDVVVKDVPAALSPIIVRMLAKRPDDRYAGMKDVIASLEGFLGVATSGPYAPKEDQVKILEFAVERYNGNFWARLRPKLILAFYAACALMALLLAYVTEDLVWKFNFAGGMVGLALLTTIVYQITVGVAKGTHLFRKIRQLVFGAGIVDWLLWTVGLGIFGFVVYSFGLWLPWLFAGMAAVMLAQGFFWTIDNLASKDRETYLRQAEHLIKQMRLKGLDENAIRQFVCKFSGRNWEEFFENLFGYEAKLQARQVWGKERGKDRPKFASWREPVIAYIDYRIESRKQLKESKLLAKLESRALQAKGIDEKLARKQANKNAQRLVSSAEVVRRESEKFLAATAAPPSSKKTAAANLKATAPDLSQSSIAMSMLTEGHGAHDDKDQHAPEYAKQSYFRRRYGSPLQIATSPMLRLALALLLLTVYANWWNQNKGQAALSNLNEVITTRQEDKTVIAAAKNISGGTVMKAVEAVKPVKEKRLELLLVPNRLTHPILPPALLVAGLLLLLGAMVRGRLLGIAMYLSAGVALLGYLPELPVIHANWFVAAMVATGIWLFSIIFLRVKHD